MIGNPHEADTNFNIDDLYDTDVVNDILESKMEEVGDLQASNVARDAVREYVQFQHRSPDIVIPYQFNPDGTIQYVAPPFPVLTVQCQNFSSVDFFVSFDEGSVITVRAGVMFPFYPPPTRRLKVWAAVAGSGFFTLLCYPVAFPPIGMAQSGGGSSSGAGQQVALLGPPTNLNANAETVLTFTTPIRHLEIQNNTAGVINEEEDATASLGSFEIPVGATYSADVSCTTVHLWSTLASALNGTAAGNVVVRGRL